MIDFNRIDMSIFKDVPRILEQWWKSSVEVARQYSNDITNNVSILSKSWKDIVDYIDILNGVNIYFIWWFIPVTIILLVGIIFPFFIKDRKINKHLKELTADIPGPRLFPVLGNIPTFAGCNLIQFFQKLVEAVKQYGPVVRFWIGDKLYIVISDAESIEHIFVNKSLVKKNSTVSKLSNGNCVVPDDEKWKIHRRIISSTFNSNVLEQFMENFAKNSFFLSDNLMPKADGTNFDLYTNICSCTLDIICETIMGINVTDQMEDCGEYKSKILDALETLGETVQKSWTLGYWIHGRKHELDQKNKIAIGDLHEFINKVISNKVESRKNGFRHRGGSPQVEYVQWVRGREVSLLDLLLQDDQVTVEETRDELTSLIAAGTRVTATTCCYVLSLLGAHQEVQEEVLEEQERIFGPDCVRHPTISDVNNMKYLEQVLKETLRLYPPVPFLFRNIEEDTKLGNGYILPRGTSAVIFSYLTHRNPEYYTDPESFNPNRFSSDKCENRNPYTYIPFGGGRRICVAYKFGMLEIKTILSTVLRKYQVFQTKEGIETMERSLQAGVVLKPANGFSVQMTSRPKKLVPNIFREE